MIGFGFFDGLKTLGGIGTHSDLCHVDVAVGGLHQTEVFFRHALAGCGELGDGANGSSL